MHKKNVLNVWTALVCAALLWPAQPAMAAESVEAGLSVERLDRLDALLEREIGAGRLSGMIVAVARHGEVVQRTYGYMNLETREKLRDDALFRLYSMTKPVASVALLTLYEQGLFQLTDPLDKYIPQFANLKVYAGKDASGKPILEAPKRKPTIQDAFRHTLGLSGGLGNTDVDAMYREAGLGMFELESVSQEMDRLAQVPLRYSPGRPVGVRLGPRRAGLPGGSVLRHGVRRLRAENHLRPARHAQHGVWRAAGHESALRHRV